MRILINRAEQERSWWVQRLITYLIISRLPKINEAAFASRTTQSLAFLTRCFSVALISIEFPQFSRGRSLFSGGFCGHRQREIGRPEYEVIGGCAESPRWTYTGSVPDNAITWFVIARVHKNDAQQTLVRNSVRTGRKKNALGCFVSSRLTWNLSVLVLYGSVLHSFTRNGLWVSSCACAGGGKHGYSKVAGDRRSATHF